MCRLLAVLAVVVSATGFALGALMLAPSEARSAPFSVVVDNTSRDFSAPGWGRSEYSTDRYGANYRFASPARNEEAAKFVADLPSKGQYTVYARWPANQGYNPSTMIGVSTTSGFKWRTVNQRRNSGKWVSLGTHEMEGGRRLRVRVSRRSSNEGYVIADAVRFVKGTASAPGGGSDAVNGYDVVREAETWLGTPYRYGGTSRDGVDCSGLSLRVYEKLGIKLPRTARDQYYSGPGTRVSTLGRGNLVFGHADGGRGIEHVGIVTGDGRMIHAPYPGTVVRYANIPANWYNVVGIKRIVPNG